MNFLIFVYLCLGLSYGVSSKSVRIVGGTEVDISMFPHLVSMRNARNNGHFCAGSIIGPAHVLTAAHCVYRIRDHKSIRVYTGANSAEEITTSVYNVARIAVHPFFTGRKSYDEMNYHDIAVATLSSRIEFNEFQNKIELPSTPVLGSTGMIAGWGATTYPSDAYSESLKNASMTIYSNSQCAQVLPFKFKDEQFCACSAEGVGPCTGDSGGPIVSGGKIVGIISFSLPCARGIPDVYTRVYSYLSFIRGSMR